MLQVLYIKTNDFFLRRGVRRKPDVKAWVTQDDS